MIPKTTDVPVLMRFWFPTALALLLVLPDFEAATVEPPVVAPSRRTDAEIQALVRQLSDESFRVREQASTRIWELGEEVLPVLKVALNSQDPELVFRTRDLIRKIQLHVTPETDPGVIALVERYGKASITEKTTLMGKMRNKKAWRQMLKLYASETSAEAREKLRPTVNGVAIRAARERLAQGDAAGAREFLELAPADNAGLMALAEFHRSHGTLDEELNRAKAIKGKKSELWQLALYRAAGDLKGALAVAQTVGETKIAAAMAGLSGDPLPWLRLKPEENENPIASTTYSSIVSRRWMGQKVRQSDLDPLLRALAQRDPSERSVAMNTLFLLGETTAAEETLTKTQPLTAFSHFESLERIPEAMKAFGLDPDHPDYLPWVRKRVDRLTKDEIEDQHGVSEHDGELLALASFLERRGLNDEASSVFLEPLATLAEKDSGVFLNLFSQFFSTRETALGAPRLGRKIAAAWAGDDEKRWGDLVTAAFGDDNQNTDWWDWLEEISPKTSRAERFDAMLALFGIGPDPDKLREKWMALAWKAVEAAPAGRKDAMVQRISRLCGQAGDVANSLKAWDLLPEDARNEVFWGQHILHLSAVDRWNDAVKVLLKQISIINDAKQEGGADLHAYTAAALRQAGREEDAVTHDEWADKFYLGDPGLAIRIGNGYAFGRDYKRAAAWWARAAFESDPETGDYGQIIKIHSDALLEEGSWKEAASTSEMVARIYSALDNSGASVLPLMRMRLQADTARALADLSSDRAGSIAVLEKCHRTFSKDGSLADFFFPALRKAGLIKEHDEWFRQTWEQMADMIKRYPDCDNTRNTAAWFASRAMRQLDDAENHLRKALANSPWQAAYLDTMAETQFAKGDRAKAIEWSKKAVNFMPDDSQLRRQQARFRFDPLPK